MSAPSKKQICDAIFKKYGFKVQLLKDGGTFYWWDADDVADGDCVCTQFQEANTHIHCLKDWPLENWVDDFEGKLEEADIEFQKGE